MDLNLLLCSSAVFYSFAGSCFAKRVNAYIPTCLLLFLRRISDFMACEGWHLLSRDQGGCHYPSYLYDSVVEGSSNPKASAPLWWSPSPPSPPPPPPRETRGRGHTGPWLVRGLYISHDQETIPHLGTTCEIHHIYEDLNESSSARPGRSQQLEIPPSLNSKQATCFSCPAGFSSDAGSSSDAGFLPGAGISRPARILSSAWFSVDARISQICLIFSKSKDSNLRPTRSVSLF
jgi:hypothetical protein